MSPFSQGFTDLCADTVVWQPLTGRDPYGKPTWGAPQTFAGRRTFKQTRVASYERGTKGQGPENISDSQILILQGLNIQYDDAVYVQGDAQPYPPILSIQRETDETGQVVYTKLLMGSANG